MIYSPFTKNSFLAFCIFLATNCFGQLNSIDTPVVNSVITAMDIEKIKGVVSSVEISEHIAIDSSGVLKKVEPWLFDKIIRFNSKNQVYRIDYINRPCVNEIIYNIDSSKFEYINFDSCSFSKRINKKTWLYDKSGNITEYSEYINGKVDRKTTAIYNDKNQLIDFKKYGSKDDLLQETSYQYDEKGKLIEYLVNHISFARRTKNIYNANNLLQEEQSIDENGNVDGKTIYKYDTKSNLVETTNYFGASVTQKELTQYDVKGKKISYVVYDAGNKVTKKSTFKYDLNGTLIEQKDLNYSENKLTGQQVIKYHSNAKIAESQTKSYNEQNIEKSSFTYKNDVNGNLTEEININVSDPNNPIKRIEKYEFDQKGNWIKKIETMTDYNNKFIVTERKINYR